MGGHLKKTQSASLDGRRPHRASPTAQLLMDYEEHLRNTLEKGLDAESYSLHTFEALLTRSMENLGEQKSIMLLLF